MPGMRGKAVRVPTICTGFCTPNRSERVKIRRTVSEMCEKPGITGLTVRAHDSKINQTDYRHRQALSGAMGETVYEAI